MTQERANGEEMCVTASQAKAFSIASVLHSTCQLCVKDGREICLNAFRKKKKVSLKKGKTAVLFIPMMQLEQCAVGGFNTVGPPPPPPCPGTQLGNKMFCTRVGGANQRQSYFY